VTNGEEEAGLPEDEEACERLGDELDLHTFTPKDVPQLIPDYIDDCLERGFLQVRIIHGKGKGVQRRIVHAALDRHPGVRRFYLAEAFAGGWGATIAELYENQGAEDEGAAGEVDPAGEKA
jgi:dsDNA-specific endonuclease/ATPase MutS2